MCSALFLKHKLSQAEFHMFCNSLSALSMVKSLMNKTWKVSTKASEFSGSFCFSSEKLVEE